MIKRSTAVVDKIDIYFSFISDFRGDDPLKKESCVRLAYENRAQYIQNKFPLKNNVLKLLSCIDLACHGSSTGAEMMKQLSNCFATVIMPSMKDEYDREVDKYHLCSNFPSSVSKRLDEWLSEVLPSLDCLHLSMLTKSAMSIFTGPMIEQLFR